MFSIVLHGRNRQPQSAASVQIIPGIKKLNCEATLCNFGLYSLVFRLGVNAINEIKPRDLIRLKKEKGIPLVENPKSQ